LGGEQRQVAERTDGSALDLRQLVEREPDEVEEDARLLRERLDLDRGLLGPRDPRRGEHERRRPASGRDPEPARLLPAELDAEPPAAEIRDLVVRERQVGSGERHRARVEPQRLERRRQPAREEEETVRLRQTARELQQELRRPGFAVVEVVEDEQNALAVGGEAVEEGANGVLGIARLERPGEVAEAGAAEYLLEAGDEWRRAGPGPPQGERRPGDAERVRELGGEHRLAVAARRLDDAQRGGAEACDEPRARHVVRRQPRGRRRCNRRQAPLLSHPELSVPPRG